MREFIKNLNKTTAGNFAAFMFIFLGFGILFAVLFGNITADSSITTQIVSIVNNIFPFIAGFYFGNKMNGNKKEENVTI